MTTGRIHSWDLSTGVDGPGTRFVLFVNGCPLRCLYCANPDTWHMRDGKEATVDEVMAEIEKYRPFVTTAGGGVTITGGEPLLQPAFTAALLRRCKEAGLHTALDTSGFLGSRATDRLLADTDLVLLDIKSFDVAAYRELTGANSPPHSTSPPASTVSASRCGSATSSFPAGPTPLNPSTDSPASSPASPTSTAWTSCPSTNWAPPSTRPSASPSPCGTTRFPNPP